jgi:hypothetical protein
MLPPACKTLSYSLLLRFLTTRPGPSAGSQSSANLRLMPPGGSITAAYDSSTGNGWRYPLSIALAGQFGTFDFVGSQNDGTLRLNEAKFPAIYGPSED